MNFYIQVAYATSILIETVDAQELSVNETITLMEWGNAVVSSLTRDKFTVLMQYVILFAFLDMMFWQNLVTQIAVKLNLENKNFKDTKKITWLADSDAEKHVPITAIEFSSLITVPNVPKVGF